MIEQNIPLNFAGYVPQNSDPLSFVEGTGGLNTLYLNEGLTCLSGGKTIRGELKILLEERGVQLTDGEIESLKAAGGAQAWLALVEKLEHPVSLSIRNAGIMTHVEYIFYPPKDNQPALQQRIA